MLKLRPSLLAIVIGSAMISRGAAAQPGSSSSLTHIVSVTVPSRVKVRVASFAPTFVLAVDAGSLAPSTQGLSLNVTATQAWVLSISSNPSSAQSSNLRWSLQSGKGFSRLTSSHVRIASGTLAGNPRAANVFFRNVVDSGSSDQQDESGAPVMLTISAP